MTPSRETIRDAVDAAVRRVRRDGILAAALAVGAVVPLALLAAWAWGPGGRMLRGGGPLLLLGVALAAGLALAGWLTRRWVRAVDEAAVAAAAERRRGLPQGSVRGVLELGRELPPGTSAALVRRGEAELSGALLGADAREIAGDVGERARRRRWRVAGVLGALVGLTVVAAFGAPERARGAWSPLLSPMSSLSAPSLPPLAVRPGHAEIPRGGALDVYVEAPYRDQVLVRWRATGDVPRSVRLPLEAGRGSASLGAVDAPLEYWVEAPDGAASERFRVRPVDPLLVSALTVDVVYPAHVSRDPDAYVGEAPPLRVPEGTRIRIRGAATRPLGAVALVREDGRELRADVVAAEFGLEWRPTVEESGRWEWRLTGAGASPDATPPAPLDVAVVADLPPVVRITVPGPDTLMPPSLRQQVVADASDDHGIAAAALVFRRVTGAGQRGPERAVPLRVQAGADRLLLRSILDASGDSLVPGDAIHYRVVARDNSPARQAASSAEHVLRLPSMADLRDRARENAGAAVSEAERLAERTRDLQSTTRDLSRQAAGQSWERRSASASGRPSPSSRLGFEEASRAREVLEEQSDLLEEVATLEQRMAELQKAVDEAGLRDPELQRRLQELRDLYRELATPEMRAELEALREAVEALDPEAVRQALERLAARQEELRRQMEESLALMRRAAAEQEMAALAREAEELSAQQEALAEAMREERPGSEETPVGEPAPPRAEQPPAQEQRGEKETGEKQTGEKQTGESQTGQKQSGDEQSGEQGSEQQRPGEEKADPERSPEQPRRPQISGPEQRAKQQEELEERAEGLNESMQSLQQQLMQIGEQEAAQQTGSAQQKGESARQSMQQASQQARQQQGQQASESGSQAAAQLGEAARQLESARQSMKEGWERQVQQAVQQATQEALNLAQREESLRQQMEQAQQQGGGPQGQMQQMRSEQAALQQGLQQLGQNLSEAGQQSGMVNREVAQALARAMLNMDRTLRAMEEQGQMPVQQAGQTVESLNQLAMSLLQNGAQMQQQAGSPMQQALQQISQAARDQAALNGQAGALAPMDLSRQALEQQLQQMAQHQRGVARRVGTVSEHMGGRENVLGRLDQLSHEAEAIARELEGGRLDPEVRARQEKLFRRLLDAGRSLEREEYNDDRVGESGSGAEIADPAALDPSLLDPSLRYPAPSAERLRDLPPAYRRLILEYFDRLNRTGAATVEPGAAPEGGR